MMGPDVSRYQFNDRGSVACPNASISGYSVGRARRGSWLVVKFADDDYRFGRMVGVVSSAPDFVLLRQRPRRGRRDHHYGT
jgi:hypothetical protein